MELAKINQIYRYRYLTKIVFLVRKQSRQRDDETDRLTYRAEQFPNDLYASSDMLYC